jgi:hypothetical protein
MFARDIVSRLTGRRIRGSHLAGPIEPFSALVRLSAVTDQMEDQHMKQTSHRTGAVAATILSAAVATFAATAHADLGSRTFALKSMTQLSPGSTQALNPQPIPPGRPVLGQRQALNPQPIPPGKGGPVAIRNPGDPPPPIGPGAKQALNPQPIPPGKPVLGEHNALNPQPIPPGRPVPGQRNALNPQPIPPGRGVMMPIRNPGDPPWVLGYGGVRARSF